jgi:hypothetical protein
MPMRVAGLVLAAAAVAVGLPMVARRLRVVVRGRIVEGTVAGVTAARAGGAFVYHLAVLADDPRLGDLEVRAYREFEVETRVRVRVDPRAPHDAWLAEWPALGYEIGVGAFLVLAGVLGGIATVVAG